MIKRTLAQTLAKSKKSILLLGPRQTGKSTLMTSLEPDLTINLAHEATYLDFLRDPRLLESRLGPYEKKRSLIFIDEVQRLPSLLNTIQVIVDQASNKFRFLLTGSSARKLKRGHANLLPGRIHSFYLGPLTASELSFNMDSKQVLSSGCLPGVLTDESTDSKEKTLKTYAATYLKEEVQAESLTRSLEGFARFLHVAAEWAGHFLDLSKMASAAQVPRQSAVRYFEILEDCLIVWRIPSFSQSLTRRLVQHPKFYFFDVGVWNGLLRNFQVSGDRIGPLFEHLVMTQVIHGSHHLDADFRISTYRTEHGAEVDLIVENKDGLFAIELKASKNIASHDLRGLKYFSEVYRKKHRSLLFYLGEERRKLDGVDILPWQQGLRELGLT